MTIRERIFSNAGIEFDDGISDAYASIRTYSNYSEAWCRWNDSDLTPGEAQAKLSAFSRLHPSRHSDLSLAQQHLLRGCMTLKPMQSISAEENPDLAITSALWLPVQAYYAVHGFGMAFLAAKNGADSLPQSHGAFMRVAGESIVQRLFPAPFSAALLDGYRGFRYLQPQWVNIKDPHLYRARIKSNYEDTTMFGERPDTVDVLLAFVRNTQRLALVLCAFIAEALWRVVGAPDKKQLMGMGAFAELKPSLTATLGGMS